MPWAQPISGSTMRSAVRIGEYLIPHARAAFALMGADPVVEDAKFVLNWIVRKEREAFSERNAFEGTKSRFKKVDALRPALNLLVTHGHIRARSDAVSTGPGRKPSPVYEVNPLVLRTSQNSQNETSLSLSAKSANSARRSKPACILALQEQDDTDAIPAAEEEFEEGTL